jgi:putative oxidoreductase
MTRKDAALVPIRATLGATMLYHGLPKLSDEGAEQTGQMFEGMGIRPGRTFAKLAGLAEVLAGATALIGFGTRIGALAVLATQGVAVAKVHGDKGFDNTSGGYEFNLALMAIALGLLVAGPGAFSLHEVVERGVKRRPWVLAPRRRRKAFSTAMLLK